jgi:hypothetical protein
MKTIQALLNVASRNLGTTAGTMDYDRITQTITTLANLLAATETTEETWWLESPCFSLDDLIVGAYWHYTEWHAGQASPEYAALSALGQIFNPNMSMPEPDNEAYQLLNALAEELQA